MADSEAIWIPVLGDFSRTGQQLERDGARVGRTAGERIGQGMALGVDAQRAAVEKATARVALAQDKVADAASRVRVAEAKLEELRQRGVTTGSQFVSATEAVERAQRREAAASRSAQTASDDLAAAQARAAAAADDTADRVDGLGRKSLVSADSMVKAGALIGAAFVGAGAALYGIATQFDDAADALRLTGASGAELDGLADSVNRVAQATPAMEGGVAQIGETMATLRQRLGLTGPALETVTSQMVQLSNIGQEVDLDTLSGAMTAFGVKGADTSKVLDELFRVSQSSGVGISELAASAIKGGPALRQFGFGLADSAALAGTLDKAGLDADKTIAAMNKSLVGFAKAGKDPKAALADTITQIQSLTKSGQDAKAIDLAGSLFGTKGAGQFVDAVRSGAFSVDSLKAAVAGSGDTILGAADDTADFAEQWQLFKQKTLVELEPLATAAFGAISGAMGFIASTGIPTVKSLGAGVAELVRHLGGAVDFVDRNRIAFGVAAGVITAILLPQLIVLGVAYTAAGTSAAISGVKQVGAWVASGGAAVTSAAVSVAASYRIVGGWVAAGAAATVGAARQLAAWVATGVAATAQAAIVSGAWIGAQVAAGAGWLAMQIRAVASFVAMGASAVAQALVSSGAWVASTAATIGALTLQGAAFVAQRAIMVAGAVATGVMTAAQWALNTALLANPIALVVVAIAALVAGIVLAYKNSETFRNIVQTAFAAVAEAGRFMYENVLKPAFDGIMSAFSAVGDALGATGRGISSAFSAVGDAIGGAFSTALDIARPALHGIGNLLAAIPDKIFGFSIPGMGLVKSFAATLQNFRDGGQVAGPGTGTSDSVPAMLSNGEFVEPAAAVTPQTLPLLEAIRGGWVPPADMLHDMVPGFADGGLVTKEALRDFARGVDGKPYVWGGVEWGDCSGAVSAVANFATGRPPFGSRFATGSEADELAARGFKPGLGPAGSLNIGWFNGGPYGGHTAATLPTGENFEMGGSYGGGKFGGTVGASDPQFSDHAHLPPEFFAGGDKLPGVDLNTTQGSAGTPPAVATAGGGSSSATTPGSTAGSGSSASAAGGSGASAMSLSDFAGNTAQSFAKETLKDTLGFFGLEKFADLPIIPPRPEPALTAPRTDRQAGEGTDPVGSGAGDGRQAPLVQVDTIVANNPDEAATKLGREVRRTVRSDALVGGR